MGPGAVSFWPSIATAGFCAGSSGQPPGPISMLKAVTLEVSTFTAFSPAISPFSARALPMLRFMASTVSQFIWL